MVHYNKVSKFIKSDAFVLTAWKKEKKRNTKLNLCNIIYKGSVSSHFHLIMGAQDAINTSCMHLYHMRVVF